MRCRPTLSLVLLREAIAEIPPPFYNSAPDRLAARLMPATRRASLPWHRAWAAAP